MQNALTVRLRRYRLLLWCLALSLVVHFVFVPFIMGLFGLRRSVVEPKEVVYQTSSALRIARVAKPRPPARREMPQAVRPPVEPRPVQRATVQRPQMQPPQQRRELARVEPRGRIAVPRVAPAAQPMDFSKQEQQFQQTIARLRRQSDPVISAARPVQTPEAPKHYAFDFRGSIGSAPQAHGILDPVKTWRDGPYDYYYVQYYVEYVDGTTESGYVPWPIRFLHESDPFRLTPDDVPLPPPLPDFVLPQDTNLHPFVAYCYEHRTQYNSCPIRHD